MWEKDDCNCNFGSYEEEYEGYDIYIERNPDPYREGYIWSVGKGCEELERDLAFELNDCLLRAKTFIGKQGKHKN